ncbi:hypothetical protein EWM64_g3120 [Hericium alpestre]|uniref:F-box domain-containing protein n=1 Tax=Hericium alpestre TaxID=135208 RepID=A0A4Z0A4R1_9AGAM|nr:hypothetical protein EWM64_g3120 [Hericium alpestre]
MVLQHLGYEDLIVCSMVCKRFHKLVKKAVELSYIVELGVDGFVDGAPSDLSTGERLQILLDLRERWRTLDWMKRESVKPHPTRRRYNNMHYAQGIFSQVMRLSSDEGQHDYSVFSTVLPTRATDAAEYGPPGKDDHLWYRAFCTDPAADVIIFAAMESQVLHGEQLGTQSLKSYLSFVPRTLSSNGSSPHPLCRSECLHLMGYPSAILDPQIAGEMVGITALTDSRRSIVIYNWQSGELVVKSLKDNVPQITSTPHPAPLTSLAASLSRLKIQVAFWYTMPAQVPIR